MSNFDNFKSFIFPSNITQRDLITAVHKQGYAASDFDDAFYKLINKTTERDLQIILAPFLRELAIRHLREGTTEYVQAFRQEYDAVFGVLGKVEPGDAISVKAFLTHQAKPYIYATDIEAGALADLLGVTFACTQVNDQDIESYPPYINYRSSQKDTKIIHLYNRPGLHFFVVEGNFSSTLADGNCLYNGFAQIIRQLLLEEEQQEISVYVNQENILARIKNIAPVPVADLVARIRAEHKNKVDIVALKQAVVLVQKDNIKQSLVAIKPKLFSMSHQYDNKQIVAQKLNVKLLEQKKNF
ncbi:OTU domain-containing protein [Legionella sp.]|uniref:OTU domain-containing protein n=1 Tax=Legionella sp. TaxID=459 RepID=UPI003CC6964F